MTNEPQTLNYALGSRIIVISQCGKSTYRGALQFNIVLE